MKRKRQHIKRNKLEIAKKFIGVNFPFGYEQTLFDLSVTTEEQTISNLKVLLTTDVGERYGNVSFGTNLRWLLFENKNQDLIEKIKREIESSIKFWLPQILIDKIQVEDSIDENTITIKLDYRVTEQGANQQIIIYANNFGELNIIDTE